MEFLGGICVRALDKEKTKSWLTKMVPIFQLISLS